MFQNLTPMILGTLVVFIGSLAYVLYRILPQPEDIKKMITSYGEKQQQKISKSVKSQDIAFKLKRSGINMYPSVFRLTCFLCAGLVTYAVASYSHNPAAGIVMAVIGYQFPHWILNYLNNAYDKRMDLQIEVLVSTTPQTVASSGSILKALESIIRIVDDPLRKELIMIMGAQRLNKSLETSFLDLAARSGHKELVAYARIINIAITQGTDAAIDSFKRLNKVLEEQKKLEQKRRADLAEYTIFVMAVIFGLPFIFVITTSFVTMAHDALIVWAAGKFATVALALMIIGSYLGYKMSTKDINM